MLNQSCRCPLAPPYLLISYVNQLRIDFPASWEILLCSQPIWFALGSCYDPSIFIEEFLVGSDWHRNSQLYICTLPPKSHVLSYTHRGSEISFWPLTLELEILLFKMPCVKPRSEWRMALAVNEPTLPLNIFQKSAEQNLSSKLKMDLHGTSKHLRIWKG